MTMISSSQAEQEAILTAAKLIMAAITTSPKGRGVSSLTCAIIEGEEKERGRTKRKERRRTQWYLSREGRDFCPWC